MIDNHVLEHLTDGGKKKPYVMVTFHQYRALLAIEDRDRKLIAHPRMEPVLDAQGVPTGKGSPVYGEFESMEWLSGHLHREAERVFALHYQGNGDQVLRLFLDWSHVTEIHESARPAPSRIVTPS